MAKMRSSKISETLVENKSKREYAELLENISYQKNNKGEYTGFLCNYYDNSGNRRQKSFQKIDDIPKAYENCIILNMGHHILQLLVKK